MSEAGEFIDAALQFESSWARANDHRERVGGELAIYGASVGAVRATIRNASLRFVGLSHDEITALSSELWGVPVFERRLAAVVLLQSNIAMLRRSDLTRIEGFLRTAGARVLVDTLVADVLVPVLRSMDAVSRVHANVVLDRWARDNSSWLRAAADAVGRD